jgi:pyruvate,water dikinase
MTTTLEFIAPGPGPWELETTHHARPMSRFMQAPMLEGFAPGFSASTARYGLLLECIAPSIVNDFIYQQPVPFGAPKGAMGPPPKLIFKLITRLVPKLRARIRASHEALETKAWRADLARWDNEVRPTSDKRHREIQAIDPATLDDSQLAGHIQLVRDRCRDMTRQHHDFTITCALPIGDLLAHTVTWTGKPLSEILPLLRGSSKVSLGIAATELAAVAVELRKDEAARALLAGAPAEAVAQLRALEGPAGVAMRAYLELVEWRCLGYDTGSKCNIEMPEMIVRAIRAALAGPGGAGDDTAAHEARIATLRGLIPEAHRQEWDALLAEARSINRLRDERAHHSDGWATGLARRALLEVGHRFVKRGLLTDPDQAVDCSSEEVIAMLGGAAGPGLPEITRRHTWRTTRSVNDKDIPQWLNQKPVGPPPADWLPAHGRRAQRALEIFLAALFEEPEPECTATTVKGLGVSPGTYEGVARLVMGEADFGRIQQGDVLVTRSTSPYFNVVLPMLGAIVTDRGGQLCHAAIVSREYGVPGVVGTRDATTHITDGARVRVDGSSGVVTVL